MNSSSGALEKVNKEEGSIKMENIPSLAKAILVVFKIIKERTYRQMLLTCNNMLQFWGPL